MAEKGATPILATQEYIWRWGASKLSEWAIGSKNHKTHRNLILFKYDQQKSPFNVRARENAICARFQFFSHVLLPVTFGIDHHRKLWFKSVEVLF
jgi:hypothetical protein